MLLWISPYGVTTQGVASGKEKVVQKYLLPNNVACLITERQRYDDVFDPQGFSIFDLSTGRLLWAQKFGRRWNEMVSWSGNGKVIATVTYPVGKLIQPRIEVYDVLSGELVGTLTTPEIEEALKKTIQDIGGINFVDGNELNVSIEDASSKDVYHWRIR